MFLWEVVRIVQDYNFDDAYNNHFGEHHGKNRNDGQFGLQSRWLSGSSGCNRVGCKLHPPREGGGGCCKTIDIVYRPVVLPLKRQQTPKNLRHLGFMKRHPYLQRQPASQTYGTGLRSIRMEQGCVPYVWNERRSIGYGTVGVPYPVIWPPPYV